MAADLSVITVTFNDPAGLERTLRSLAGLSHPPREVLVIDGGTAPVPPQALGDWCGRLPVNRVAEPDKGIYDAMNKGRARARGRLLHYLNGGDVVTGEPYAALPGPCRLPVTIVDPARGLRWRDRVKMAGFGYCHQGLVLPAGHRPFDLRYRLSADIDLLHELFPAGLDTLPLVATGGVEYPLGGQSSQRLDEVHREIRAIFARRGTWRERAAVWAFLGLKSLVPRPLRRVLAAWRAGGSER